MNINYTSRGEVQASNKNQSAIFGAEVKIGDYTIPSAGEYDVSGIACEVASLETGLAYFVRFEDLTITYLSCLDLSATKLDDASSTDILIVDLNSEARIDTLKSIIKSLEPAYVFLVGAGYTSEFGTNLSIPIYAESTLKVTRTGLPLEGTQLVLNK